MTQPLAGITVLELATGIAGPYAAKLFADLGADVVKVEPPGGDPSRHAGPFPDDVAHPEQSALFLHLNTNKRSIVADVTSPEGRARVLALAAGADVVIESSEPGGPDDLVDALRAVRGDLVVTSVTPFGRTGPYVGRPAEELTLYAMGGAMQSCGLEDREPVKLGGDVGRYQCGAVAALASLAALTVAERSGEGVHVDVANLETQAGSIDRRMTYLLYQAYTGLDAPREAGLRPGPLPSGVFPTEDGYAFIANMPAWLPRMLATVQDPDLAARYTAPGWVVDPDLPDQAMAAMFGWAMARGRQAAMEQAQANGWAVTALNAPVDVLTDPHFDGHRRFFVDVAHPVAGSVRQPGPPVRMDDGWQLHRPAPTLGQHDAEVALPARPARALEPSAGARLPLEGVRVLDLTVVWAGPYATMFLADLGADVIRIDNPWIFPTATRGLLPRPPKELAADLGPLFGSFPDRDPGPRPWNRLALFTAHARGKRNITLDLRKDLGRETFLRLCEHADVVVENNAATLLDKLGLGWDELHARNPRLIVVRMPSTGLDGPYRDYLGFGINFETLTGLTAVRGYADLDPTSIGSVYHMDAASGPAAALATLAALRRRERSGAGELVELAQSENMMQHIGELFVDAARTGRRHGPLGNRHRVHAPQGVYPAAGEDRWVALSVTDDAGWRALCGLLGQPAWAGWDRDRRRTQHDEIDAALSAWSAGRTPEDAAEALVAVGVAAGPVHRERDCYADPQLQARGFFRDNGNDELGTHRYPGHCWQWTGPALRWGPPAVLGADNRAVYQGVAGLSDEEYAALGADGHLSEDYLGPDGTPL
ncbi:MAG: CoA transferase [Acidimicrobiales bacterium]